jgi:hypothetical protein
MNDILRQAVKNALVSNTPQQTKFNPYYLFADAKPSESIQPHEMPGLSVACLLPIKKGEEILKVPVKQYKDYKPKNRAARAHELKDWLKEERNKGLIISGFLLSRTQLAAARYGLDLIEELPDTRVEKHYETYRLYFGEEEIDFAQAVALIYYTFVVNFAVLRASNHATPEHRKFLVFMDRFPGASAGELAPRQSAPKTQGMKFIEFIRARAETAIEIDKANAERNIDYKVTTLEWWRESSNDAYKAGKTHPHFSLTDWLAAAALAREFKTEFIASYPNSAKAEETAIALIELYDEFKKFSIWEIVDDATLNHIVSNKKLWSVPETARHFILQRAES